MAQRTFRRSKEMFENAVVAVTIATVGAFAAVRHISHALAQA